jgi:hypothetical protein
MSSDYGLELVGVETVQQMLLVGRPVSDVIDDSAVTFEKCGRPEVVGFLNPEAALFVEVDT